MSDKELTKEEKSFKNFRKGRC